MKLNKIDKDIYEMPCEGEMKVPVKIFANEKILSDMEKDKTLQQIKNVSHLPGILVAAMLMPDGHQGYGFPIGGVAGFDLAEGVITPAGIGYDVNCSVRLLKTNLLKRDILKKQKEVIEAIYRKIPSGLGRGSSFQISRKKFYEVLKGGAQYLVKEGYGKKADYMHTEELGCLCDADPSYVSEEAIKRGIGQLGTLGSGNHFLEVGYVEKIFDEKIAEVFGLKEDLVTIMIHCGSRGLGHQIISDYIDEMKKQYKKENFPDPELVYAPIKSSLGKSCLSAMACATNFAFANKQLITYWLREELSGIYPEIEIDVVYDVCHNIAKFEEHKINGKMKTVLVHRKGATRSFGPGRIEIPSKYRKVGQPVIIPGSMGTSSYVLVGTKKSEELTFGSTVHGAGRVKSRHQAMSTFSSSKVVKELSEKGIEVRSRDKNAIAEEAPGAYKDVEDVVEVVHELGLSKKIAKLKPLAVLK